MQPLVSIIVPVYNAGQFLAQCVSSLFAQTYPAIEILLVDDGSTDNSPQLCRQLAQQDARVRVLHQPNAGVSAARNAGLAMAQGELFTFVDADDWVDPEHIEGLVRGIRQADCSICGYCQEYPGETHRREYRQLQRMDAAAAQRNMLSPDLYQGFLWNKLFRRSLAADSRLNETLFYLEDLNFCAHYFGKCTAVFCTGAATYHYRQHPQSAVNRSRVDGRWLTRRQTALQALQQLLDCCADPAVERLVRARIQTEAMEILNRLVAENALADEQKRYIRLVRRGLLQVLCAPLPLRIRVKYTCVALCPSVFSPYFLRREMRLLPPHR